MMAAAAHLYGLEEWSRDHSLVASSESALGALRANLIPEWSRYVCVDPATPMTIKELRERLSRAEAAGYVLVEPERAVKGGPAIERAIQSFITDGALAKPFLFVPRSKAKSNGVVKLKEQRALDGVIESKLDLKTGDIAATAFAILRDRGPMRGAELLREARSRFGKTSTQDAITIGRSVVEAWHASHARIEI